MENAEWRNGDWAAQRLQNTALCVCACVRACVRCVCVSTRVAMNRENVEFECGKKKGKIRRKKANGLGELGIEGGRASKGGD